MADVADTKVLVIEDDAATRDALSILVADEGFEVQAASDFATGCEAMRKWQPALVLADLLLPDGRSTDLLGEASELGVEVALITGNASLETAVEALRLGALDYLTKPIDTSRLQSLLNGFSRTRELKSEISTLRRELREAGRLGPLVGSSESMKRLFHLIERVAPTDATVLVTGESGTGKELVASAVHQLSRRHNGPFHPLNCGAVSETLIESELFGHERGSFTGAEKRHVGLFERSSGGTLFLDEVTEMPIELQVKLLRALENRRVRRIGGDREFDVDVRVIAATNRDPAAAVVDGKLREDLYYRLKVFPIDLPPLRERSGDIELLSRHFLGQLNEENEESADATQHKRLSDEALALLESYSWPGNVRELRNVLQRAHILADERIGADSLPSELRLGAGLEVRGRALSFPLGTALAEVERRMILATLDDVEGKRQEAAEILGISVKTLYNRLKEYEASQKAAD